MTTYELRLLDRLAVSLQREATNYRKRGQEYHACTCERRREALRKLLGEWRAVRDGKATTETRTKGE